MTEKITPISNFYAKKKKKQTKTPLKNHKLLAKNKIFKKRKNQKLTKGSNFTKTTEKESKNRMSREDIDLPKEFFKNYFLKSHNTYVGTFILTPIRLAVAYT